MKFQKNWNVLIFFDKVLFMDKKTDKVSRVVEFGPYHFSHFQVLRDLLFGVSKQFVSLFHPVKGIQNLVSVNEPNTCLLSLMIDRVFLLSSRTDKSGKQTIKAR
jgi:hypothetical protein